MSALYVLTNSVFRNFIFYSVASLLKMMVMSLLTTRQRFRKNVTITYKKMQKNHPSCFSKAFVNPEDIRPDKRKIIQPTTSDPDVERVRRNHLNDIENIIPFVLIGFFYVASNPNPVAAVWHFRLFFFSRLVHTFAYQVRGHYAI